MGPAGHHLRPRFSKNGETNYYNIIKVCFHRWFCNGPRHVPVDLRHRFSKNGTSKQGGRPFETPFFQKTGSQISVVTHLRPSFSKNGETNYCNIIKICFHRWRWRWVQACARGFKVPFFKKRDLEAGRPPIWDAVFQKTGSQISVVTRLRPRFSKNGETNYYNIIKICSHRWFWRWVQACARGFSALFRAPWNITLEETRHKHLICRFSKNGETNYYNIIKICFPILVYIADKKKERGRGQPAIICFTVFQKTVKQIIIIL